MPVVYQRMTCGICGCDLNNATGTVRERQPCGECGSTVRRAEVGINSTATARSTLSFKARKAGRARPFAEGKVGDDLHRKSGRWFRLERVVDRARNWYLEIISDRTTGEVIRHVEEPLSEHTGHGAARLANRRDVKGVSPLPKNPDAISSQTDSSRPKNYPYRR